MKGKRIQRGLSVLLTILFLITQFPGIPLAAEEEFLSSSAAHESASGLPEMADLSGLADPSESTNPSGATNPSEAANLLKAANLLTAAELAAADHLIINQAYGSGKNADGAISHSFIEIYNPTEAVVDVSGWSLQYAENGSAWAVLELNGEIPSGTSYLVRANGGRTSNTRYEIYYADQNWPVIISNDTFKFALVNHRNALTIYNPGESEGVVDLVGAQNDVTVDYGEGGHPVLGMSKQKPVRRTDFIDTDDNAADFTAIDYRANATSDTRLREVRPRSLRDGYWMVGDQSPLPVPPVEVTVGFSASAGLYVSQFDLELSIATDEPGGVPEGYIVRYTLDGEDPAADSPVYAGPLTMRDRTTDNEVMVQKQYTTSLLAMHETYVRPPLGTVYKGTVVKAQVFDGEGQPASGIVTNSYFVNGDIYNRYGNLPIISLATPADYFFDLDTGIYVRGDYANDANYIFPDNRPGWDGTIWNWDQSWERPINFEMFAPEAGYNRVISQGMGVRIHGGVSRNSAQKSLRFYARNGMVESYPLSNGKNSVDYDLFQGNAKDHNGNVLDSFKRFTLRAHGNDIASALIRDPLVNVLAADFANEALSYRPAVVFLNGEFWGLYEMQERYDDEYLAQHYGGDKNYYDILENPSSLGMDGADGTPESKAYYLSVVAHLDGIADMNTPQAYDEVLRYVDEDSLIDYTIMKTFIGDNDWVNRTNDFKKRYGNNNEVWRYTGAPTGVLGQDGKYRFLLKDSDMAFLGGFGDNGGGTGSGAQGMAFDSISETLRGAAVHNHYFFARLMQNDKFKTKFLNRYMDVRNSWLSLGVMHATTDRLAGGIAPLLPEQKQRWNYTPDFGTWEGQIDWIKDQMTARASEDPAVSGITKDLNLLATQLYGQAGLATLTMLKAENGYIRLNALDLKPGFPGVAPLGTWTGRYYVGSMQTIKAVAAPGYSFSHFIVGGETIANSTHTFMVPSGGMIIEAVFGGSGEPEYFGPDHVVINQAAGIGDYQNDGSSIAIEYSFVELYNPTDAAVDISGWSLQYAESGATWAMLPLVGAIAPHSSYLVRANGPNVPGTRLFIPDADLDWDVMVSNKVYKFALVDNQNPLTVYNPTAAQGVVDLVGANNSLEADWYEGTGPVGKMSKQQAVRRINFADYDQNWYDFESADYRDTGTAGKNMETYRPRWSGDGAWGAGLIPPPPPIPTEGTITFSRPAGIYADEFALTLSTATNNTVIRYTLDGEDPTNLSAVYASPLAMRDRTGDPHVLLWNERTTGPRNEMPPYDRNAVGELFKGTVVKARLYNESGQPISGIYINSYYINEDIAALYGSLPVISMSAPAGYLFDNENKGIYVKGPASSDGLDSGPYNFDQKGSEWERPVYLEMFDPAYGVGWETNAAISQGMGLRIHGGASRHFPQKSLRFYARSGSLSTNVNGGIDGVLPIINGKNSINYDMFDGMALDANGNALTGGFKRFMLRAGGNDAERSFIRDAINDVLAEGLDTIETQAYRPAVLFINGEFWGMFEMLERFDDEYLAQHYGGSAGDYRVLENPSKGKTLPEDNDADAIAYYEAKIAVVEAIGDMNTQAAYDILDSIVDISSLIDYVIIETLGGNTDWVQFAGEWDAYFGHFVYTGNNQRMWYYAKTDDGLPGHDGRFRWMLYDTDKTWGYEDWSDAGQSSYDTIADTLIQPSTGEENDNLYFFRRLMENDLFRSEFVGRYLEALGTWLSLDVMTAAVDNVAAEVSAALIQHRIRWPFTYDAYQWAMEIAGIKSWMAARVDPDGAFVTALKGYADPIYYNVPGVYAAYAGVAASLPDTISFNANGATVTAPVLWDTGSFLSAQAYDRISLSGIANGHFVMAVIEVIPEDLIYFIDAGTIGDYPMGTYHVYSDRWQDNAGNDDHLIGSAAYDLIKGRMARSGKTLLNDVSDQIYDGGAGWGLVEDSYQFPSVHETNGDKKLASGYVGFDDNESYADKKKAIEYVVDLPAGTYGITTGHYCWWSLMLDDEGNAVGGYPRSMQVLYNDVPYSGVFTFANLGDSLLVTNTYVHAGGTLSIKSAWTGGDGSVLSFIGITTPGGVEIVDELIGVDGGTHIETAVYVGEEGPLPGSVMLLYTVSSPVAANVAWDYAPLLSASVYDTVYLTGAVEGTDITMTAKVEVIPEDLVYFIDAGTANDYPGLWGNPHPLGTLYLEVNEGIANYMLDENLQGSAAYDLVKGRLAADGKPLYNGASDQKYNDVWGYYEGGVQFPVAQREGALSPKFMSGYVGWDVREDDEENPDVTYEDKDKFIEYKLYLPAGKYLVTTGHYCWWDPSYDEEGIQNGGFARTMEVRFNDVAVGDPFTFSNLGDYRIETYEYYHMENGEFSLKSAAVEGDGATLTFVGVQYTGAIVVVNEYTVAFDADNGSEAVEVTVAEGETVVAPEEPEKEGFIFLGWFAEGVGAAFDFGTAIYGDLALTAKWAPATPAALVINQATGVGNNPNGAVQYSFAEIYNPTNEDVALDGWSLQYATNSNGGNIANWNLLELEGVIPAKHSYLVRMNGGLDLLETILYIAAADMDWNIEINNDTFMFALVCHPYKLPLSNPVEAIGVVDFVGATNNHAPMYFEGSEPAKKYSKQQAIRRVGFVDTDDNLNDFPAVDYRPANGMTPEKLGQMRPRSLADGAWGFYMATLFDDGSEPIEIIAVHGLPIEAPEDPEKEGFTFLGWFAEGAGDAFDFSKAIFGDVELTAKWAPKTAILYGDVNGDGVVDLLDAAILTYYVAGWNLNDLGITYFDLSAADVNDDGVVDLLDAAILAYHTAGWPEYAILPYIMLP